jgi:hypothetical protein
VPDGERLFATKPAHELVARVDWHALSAKVADTQIVIRHALERRIVPFPFEGCFLVGYGHLGYAAVVAGIVTAPVADAVPDGMRDQLKESAKANNRSLNAEIVARLQDSFSWMKERKELLSRLHEADTTRDVYQLMSEEFATGLQNREAALDLLREQLADLQEKLAAQSNQTHLLKSIDKQLHQVTKGLAVYGRAFELSTEGDQPRALEILDKAIDEIEESDRANDTSGSKKTG